MSMTPALLASTAKWMLFFRADWHDVTPDRIHVSDVFAQDGTPEWDKGFEDWINGFRRNSERRARLASAMRRLRSESVREYEVAYRMIVLGEHIAKTTEWLNERAIRNGKEDRYSLADTRIIIVSAVDKLLAWW